MSTLAAEDETKPSQPETTRALYVACFVPSPMFPAHWGLWAPGNTDPSTGTLIQVLGDPLNGFQHEFERQFRPLSQDNRGPLLHELGHVEERYLSPIPAGGDATASARNELERLALSIAAPPRSLLSPGPSQVIRPLLQQRKEEFAGCSMPLLVFEYLMCTLIS